MQVIKEIKSSDLHQYEMDELIKIFFLVFPILNYYSIEKDYKLLYSNFLDFIKPANKFCELKKFYKMSIEFKTVLKH